MSGTIVVAVNDSPDAFAAVAVAIEQARLLGSHLHAVMVIEDGEMARHLGGAEETASRREMAADAVLRHVSALAGAAGITVTSSRRAGRVAAAILQEARLVDATMIVMARADRPGHAIPSIGSHTLRVLEFSTVPVLVVPRG